MATRPEYFVHTFSRDARGERCAFLSVRCRGTMDGESLYFNSQKRRIHDARDFLYIEWKGDIYKVQRA